MQTLEKPWAVSVDDAVKELDSTKDGLTDSEVSLRLAKYGQNIFHGKKKESLFSVFLKQFVSPLIFILLAAAFLTGLLREWIDMGVILFAVLLNVVLGCYHEYNAENTLDKLTTYIKDRSKVIRNGHEQEIDSAMIVPGDILKLSYGSRIPADARILNENNLRVDEAILTGESLPVEKTAEAIPLTAELPERKNIAHAGTLVVEGFANALVYATGDHTEIGKIAGIVSKVEKSKTPLQKGVDKLAWFIFIIVIFVVIGILILGVYRGEPLLPMLILSSAVAVGAVPEALPIALTVILAIGATRIAKKKGVIRKLSAAETLGSTTLIMTDKTGTLTKADMQLVGISTVSSLISTGKVVTEESFGEEEKKLLQMSLLNVDVITENPNEEESKWSFKGRPFEVNIVKSCIRAGISLSNMQSASLSLVLPFNSTNKFSVANDGDSYTIMGAPDILLKKSNISKEEYIRIEEWIERTSREGKRLIGLATLKKKHSNKKFNISEIEDIEFLGMLLFFDPIRPEVPQAIKNIEAHGMKMVLVTGDLPGTALSVSKDLDWHVKEDEVLIGSDLRKMSDKELYFILPKIKIFARVTPEDKLRIGTLYQQLGEVVAMTGDGVNDSPSLKAMDIGISLGSGSDVAKSAADMVLLDDNFETISMAIDEGRKILANIRKTFVYLMSNSLDEVFVIGGSLLFALPLPLTALQIIWVNLFTGSLPALSFAFDEDIDKDKYTGRDLRLIFTREVKVLTLGIGVLSSAFLFILYYFLIKISLDPATARSIFFVCFSSYILAITFSFRSLHNSLFSFNVFSNKRLNISIIIAVVILIATMTIPFMREIFEIAPLPLVWLPFVFLWLILNVLLIEGAKYVMRKTSNLYTKKDKVKFYFVNK
ncbi:MAG: cation-transporting P-type ATPase [bacterium]|nr:cation-transporting P-type ATPase [bacterium]